MCNAHAWPQQCWKSCANGSNIVALHFGDHGTKEMLGVLAQKFDRFQTLRKNCQKHLATCNRGCERTQHVTSDTILGVTTKSLHKALGTLRFKDGSLRIQRFLLALRR